MTRAKEVVVFGGSGFVGRAVVSAVEAAGHRATVVRSPRLAPCGAGEAREQVAQSELVVAALAEGLGGVDAVVNAAGNPDASEGNEELLVAANGVLPGVLAAACSRATPEPRFVHVSSAVVQGRKAELDASTVTDGFSAYARSKILGEELTMELAPAGSVIYRPPSVHAPDRRVTRMISRVAASSLGTVAAPGDAPSPQALLPNMAAAIAFLATTDSTPPPIVTHPSEGLTTSLIMELLGGRKPMRIPRAAARGLATVLSAAGGAMPPLAANARRIELLWFGQRQAPSWLTAAGWTPPAGLEEWAALGEAVRRRSAEAKEQKGHSR